MLVGLSNNGIAQLQLTIKDNSPLSLSEQSLLVSFAIIGIEAYVELQVVKVQKEDYKFLYQASQENIAGLKTQLELQGKIQDLTEQEWWDNFSTGVIVTLIAEGLIILAVILL